VQHQFTAFITCHGNLERLSLFEPTDKIDHFGERLGLLKHELAKIGRDERSLLIEDHAVQIFFERELADFVRIKRQMMPLLPSPPIFRMRRT